MSYIFEIDGETVWSPALQVGAVYHRFVQALEASLGVRAGISEFGSDYLVIDRTQLVTFVGAVREFSRHPVAAALCTPVLAVTQVMLQRAGVPGDPASSLPPEAAADIGAPLDLAALAGRMPV